MNTNIAAEQVATTKIPTVLTIKDAVQKIKQECPGTAISEHYLRQLIRDGGRLSRPAIRASKVLQVLNLHTRVQTRRLSNAKIITFCTKAQWMERHVPRQRRNSNRREKIFYHSAVFVPWRWDGEQLAF